jgi:hypothetical protein
MSKRGRSIVAALTGLIFLFSGIAYGLSEQSRRNEEAQHRASDYAKRAAYKIEQACVRIPAGREQAGCLKQAVAEYRLQADDNRRNYDDLIAQQTAALWTSIMGVAALIGMALSVVGVALVYTTFKETRKTNILNQRESARATRRAIASAHESAKTLAVAKEQTEVAKTTARRQLQPYPLATRAMFSIEKFEKPVPRKVESFERPRYNIGRSTVSFVVRNFGVTPAFNVTVKGIAHEIDVARMQDGFAFPEVGNLLDNTDIPPHEEVTCIIPNDFDLTGQMGLMSDLFAVIAHGTIEFEDVFGERYVIDWGFKGSGAEGPMQPYRGGNRQIAAAEKGD